MQKLMRSVLATLLFMGFLQMPLAAADTGKFDFYYQRLEKVVQLEPENPPSTPWENVKSFFTKGLNFVKKYVEKSITRNLFPGQGKKLWYSEENPKIAYQVRRTKVTSEAQLLQLMGVTNGDPSRLSDGQKALLAIYRNANQEHVKDLANKAIYPRINVHLSDTTGFEDEAKYPDLERDFWPKSLGFSITMPSNRYAYANSDQDAVGTFVHETAHCSNLTVPEFIKPYGPDGTHYLGELTKPRMAFQEGWSEYQEALFNPEEANRIEYYSTKVKVEDAKKPGKYTTLSVGDSTVSGKDCFSCEAMNAWMFCRLAKEIPDGEAKVKRAFFHQNFPWRDMQGFLKGFAKLNPADAGKMAAIVDEVTDGKLSDAELSRLAGNGAAATAYIAGRDDDDTPGPSSSTAALPGPARSVEATAPATSMTIQAELEAAYRQYMEAAKAKSVAGIKAAKALLERVRAKQKQLLSR